MGKIDHMMQSRVTGHYASAGALDAVLVAVSAVTMIDVCNRLDHSFSYIIIPEKMFMPIDILLSHIKPKIHHSVSVSRDWDISKSACQN